MTLYQSVQKELIAANYDEAARGLAFGLKGTHELFPTKIAEILSEFPPEYIEINPDLIFVRAFHALKFDDLDQAAPLLQRASISYLRNKNIEQAIECYLHLVSLYQRGENFQSAYVYIQEARKLVSQIENPYHQAKLLLHVAELCPDIGRLHEGLHYAQQALDYFCLSKHVNEHFQALRFLAIIERQLGDYTKAGAHLEMARQLFLSTTLSVQTETSLLNAEAHLAWYRGQLSEAMTLTTYYEEMASRQQLGKHKIYAATLRGNLQRAQCDYDDAMQSYQVAIQLTNDCNFDRYLPWLSAQISWCHLLHSDLDKAREQIYIALEQADYGQMMSFNITLAVYHLLCERYIVAKDLLLESLEYYIKSGDELTISVIHWYLAFIASQVGNVEEAQSLLKPIFQWMVEQNVTSFPLWWHPGIARAICTWALVNGLNPVIVERILVQQLGDDAFLSLQPRYDSEFTGRLDDPMAQERIETVLTMLRNEREIDLSYIHDQKIKETIEDLLQNKRLLRPGFARLEHMLTTANHQQRPNPVLIAVFGLYIHDYSTPDIAKALGRSQPSIRNYITTLYQIFDLPRHEYPSPPLRKRQLITIARSRGFINGVV